MKVILLQNVEDVGKKYEVKEVKDGYARNFLIPQNLAKPATKQALKWLDSQKEVIAVEVEEELKKFQELASNLDDLEVQITLKVGDEGQLFESVNAQKIAEKLKEMGFDVKKSQIDLKDAIKQTGEFKLKINLDHNLEAEINLSILPENQGKKEE
jgi:large subunit ribosomal protein L9